MKQHKVIINYKWWRYDEQDIDISILIDLDYEAIKRIKKMLLQDYCSGELYAEIDDIQYRGWWDVKYNNKGKK